MTLPFPPAPEGVPPELAAASPSLVRHSRAAMVGLLLFVLLYGGLTAWLLRSAALNLQAALLGADPDHLLRQLSSGAASLLFGGFLLTRFFRIRRHPQALAEELSESDQPELFAFVHRVADEVGAPRPHRIYITPGVEAAVFYDLAFWNLILPTRKNLLIGLGLVEALQLDEFKAVIAHEFGHFSQRSMRVGAWVYLSRQIVAQIVERGGTLDSVLDGISRLDLRIAWVGWIARIFLWSLRAVLDTAFRGVILLERALSREMEFQADLVAVSQAGSDSIVHALHKMTDADSSWGRVLQLAASRAGRGRWVQDLYALQERVTRLHREVHDEPNFGAAPPMPAGGGAQHRVFRPDIAEAPQMWSSHPPNHERESKARERYIASTFDPRPTWLLFRDADGLRARMSRKQLTHLLNGREEGPAEKQVEEPLEETLALVEAQFRAPHLAPRYRGVWTGRAWCVDTANPAELALEIPERRPERLLQMVEGLYPEGLRADLEQLAALDRELGLLRGLQDGQLRRRDGAVEHRGQRLTHGQLPGLIATVELDLSRTRARLALHDRSARGVHLAIARLAGGGWEEHLRSLHRFCHYLEHQELDLLDAEGALQHMWGVYTADGRLTSGEVASLCEGGLEVWRALDTIVDHSAIIQLSPGLQARLGGQSWAERFPRPFQFPRPAPELLAEGWLAELDKIASGLRRLLDHAQAMTLHELLEREDELAQWLRTGGEPPQAPPPLRLPPRWTIRLRTDLRPRTERISTWERFLYDGGALPTAGRLALALPVLGAALYTQRAEELREVVLYNALSIPVQVKVEGEAPLTVGPLSTLTLQRPPGQQLRAVAEVGSERIGQIELTLPEELRPTVWNLIPAAPLLKLEFDGQGQVRKVEELGQVELVSEELDGTFAQAERLDFELKETRSAVVAAGRRPEEMLGSLNDPTAQGALALVQARWARQSDPELLRWLEALPAATQLELLGARTQQRPRHAQLRARQLALAEGVEREALCGDLRAQSGRPDPALAWLSLSCETTAQTREAALRSALEAQPANGWLLREAAERAIAQERWSEAMAHMDAVPVGYHNDSLDGVRWQKDTWLLRRMVAGLEDPAEIDRVAPKGLKLVTPVGTPPPGPRRPNAGTQVEATQLLRRGRLEELSQLWSLDPRLPVWPEMVVLVGVSDGASREQRQRALGQLIHPLLAEHQHLRIYQAALALRETGELKTEGIGPQGAAWLRRLAQADLPAGPEAWAGLGDLPLEERGVFAAAGVIALGSRAPQSWCLQARAFALYEARPYCAIATPATQ